MLPKVQADVEVLHSGMYSLFCWLFLALKKLLSTASLCGVLQHSSVTLGLPACYALFLTAGSHSLLILLLQWNKKHLTYFSDFFSYFLFMGDIGSVLAFSFVFTIVLQIQHPQKAEHFYPIFLIYFQLFPFAFRSYFVLGLFSLPCSRYMNKCINTNAWAPSM